MGSILLGCLGNSSEGKGGTWEEATKHLKTKGVCDQLSMLSLPLWSIHKYKFSLWDLILSQELNTARKDGDSNDSLRKTINLAYHFFCHVKTGKKVYDVSERLGQQLKDTELRGLSAQDIRLPYKNIYICVPPSMGFEVVTESVKQDFEARGPKLPELVHFGRLLEFVNSGFGMSISRFL